MKTNLIPNSVGKIEELIKQLVAYTPKGRLVDIQKAQMIEQVATQMLVLSGQAESSSVNLLPPSENDPMPSTAALIVRVDQISAGDKGSLLLLSKTLKDFANGYCICVGNGHQLDIEFDFLGTYVKLVPAE